MFAINTKGQVHTRSILHNLCESQTEILIYVSAISTKGQVHTHSLFVCVYITTAPGADCLSHLLRKTFPMPVEFRNFVLI